MKKYILFVSVLLLSACSMGNMQVENPFSSTTNVQNVYLSQFPDVPIPADMKSNPSKTITTMSSTGEKVGKEVLTGRVEHNSLGAAMAHNLKNQAWNMLGIVQGKATLQLYSKGSRFLIVMIEDGNFSSTLTLWMMNQLGGANNFPPEIPGHVQDIFMDSPPNYQDDNVTPLTQDTPAHVVSTNPNQDIQALEQQIRLEQQATQTQQNSNFDSFGNQSLFK